MAPKEGKLSIKPLSPGTELIGGDTCAFLSGNTKSPPYQAASLQLITGHLIKKRRDGAAKAGAAAAKTCGIH